MTDWFKDYAQTNFENLVPHHALRVLQIGAYEGDATLWLTNNRTISTQDDVDPWAGPELYAVDYAAAEQVYDRYRENWPHVYKWKMTSDEFFCSGFVGRYDFIYIDGDHDPDQVYRDGSNAWRYLDRGGLLAFDDYLWELNGLRPAEGIDRFLVETVDAEIVLFGYQVWVRKL